jgi:pimeloyl-ACP methyl ester carboxylesterase
MNFSEQIKIISYFFSALHRYFYNSRVNTILMKNKQWFPIGILVLTIVVIFLFSLSNANLPIRIVYAEDGNQGLVGERVTFTSNDGVLLVGSYFTPQSGINNSTPSVILLNMIGRDRSTWNEFAQDLSHRGYAVLSVDLRGHGESIRKNNSTISYQSFVPNDFKNMTLDVKAAKEFLIGEKNANPYKVSIIGASIGANIALNYAASDHSIKSVILLSPGLDYMGVTTLAPITQYKNPIYIAAAEGDSQSANDSRTLCQKITCHENIRIFEKTDSHGTDMLSNDATGLKLRDVIFSWLDSTFEPED